MSNIAIVDDQSSQIQYTGLWTTGGNSTNYDRTTSASRAPGATMTFSFSGTFASVVGSLDANTSCSASFSLDANTTTFVSPVPQTPLIHETFWTSAALPDGPHTLTYTLSSCSSNTTGYVWFDYILYGPSPNASTNGLVYFLDDTDPRVAYSGNWTSETGNDVDFQSTSHGGQPGSSFQLAFEGISVSVYGRVGNDSAGAATKASFSIDGASPAVFSTPFQNSVSYNLPLFQSDLLGSGQHTLNATAQSATLWIDYILVQADTATVKPTPHHSSLKTGSIAGIAVGASILAVGLALAAIFRRRLFPERFSRRQRAPPPRPYTRPPDININSPPDTRENVSASSHRSPWHSSDVHNTYPPTLSSGISDSDSREGLHPFPSPPVSPRPGSHTTSSSGGSRAPLIPPSSRPYAVASSSGHSRRIPSLGGDEADIKRRQQLPAPAYDDSLISNGDAQSGTSSVRPLPVIPDDTTRGPSRTAAAAQYDHFDDSPPVYTYRF